MLTPAVILGLIAIVELALGIGLLAFVFNPLQNAGWPAHRKQAAFVASGIACTYVARRIFCEGVKK